MPRFAELEAKHGSLTKAFAQQPKSKKSDGGARYSMFVAPREGMSSLANAIADKLPCGLPFTTNTRVQSDHQDGRRLVA